jgi:lysine-N-methylase
MSMPLRHLPVVQNWDCHHCTNCCREYDVAVSDDERRRIEAQGWEKDAALASQRLFVRRGLLSRGYRLNHRKDGGCVFLSADNRCRIHERFGAEAKPLACRLFPFILVPAGDHWRVGIRFACPSAADNKGGPLSQHHRDLNRFADLLEKQGGLEGQTLPPPALQGRQRVEWPDLFRFVQALLTLLRNQGDRMERRLRKCLALANLCRQARFDNVTGKRLAEFLNVVSDGLETEVPADPTAVPRPGWIGRVLFRQVLAIFGRKDRGEHQGVASRGRLALLWAAWKFARGRGTVPRVNGLLPQTTFARVEEPAGPLPAAAEEVLERYYRVKVESLQFCGPTNFGMRFWDGLESLALTFPAIMWLARAFRNGSREQAVAQAVGIVDDHFGYNRILSTARHRLTRNILARRGELERLIAWYSR